MSVAYHEEVQGPPRIAVKGTREAQGRTQCSAEPPTNAVRI